MSWSYTVRLASCDWIFTIHEPVSPTDKASNFIVISIASIYNTSFCFISEVRICGNKVEINHCLCCTLDIWKLTLAINVLNLWLKSQTNLVGNHLIYLIFVIHCDSNLGFLNSSISFSWIWSNVLCWIPVGTTENFILKGIKDSSQVVQGTHK